MEIVNTMLIIKKNYRIKWVKKNSFDDKIPNYSLKQKKRGGGGG